MSDTYSSLFTCSHTKAWTEFRMHTHGYMHTQSAHNYGTANTWKESHTLYEFKLLQFSCQMFSSREQHRKGRWLNVAKEMVISYQAYRLCNGHTQTTK